MGSKIMSSNFDFKTTLGAYYEEYGISLIEIKLYLIFDIISLNIYRLKKSKTICF